MVISKVFFISDLHGNPIFLRPLCSLLGQENHPFLLISLGDHLCGYTTHQEQQEVIELLRPWASQMIAVRGNCDRSNDQDLLPFSIAETSKIITLDQRTFFLTHGHIFSPSHLPPVSPLQVFCSGHTHIPLLKTTAEDIVLFNPGSIGSPRGGFPPTFGIYENQQLSIINALDFSILTQIPMDSMKENPPIIKLF